MSQDFEISVLPEHIANQIAAGEVVERPESIVKELVENALDAGAGSVAVHVRNAGKDLIMVQDNGRGMRGADLERSVLRHATSKVREATDLHNIRTLGFRGEALAAIAAVADLEIRSRRQDEEHGWRLTTRPSAAPTIEPDAVSEGTQVVVRNLFYNVPARRKFLRANLTEFRHINDTMLKFALGNPAVQFSLHDDDRSVLNLAPSDEAGRVAAMLGAQSAEQLIPIAYESELLKIHGFVGPPSLARKSRADQHFFMNGRIIVSRKLSHAVLTAFEHILDKLQYPVFVLYLLVDPQRVDVNVHPRKQEVKFDEDRQVYNAILDAVSAGLRTRDVTPRMSADAPAIQAPFERVGFGDRPDPMLVNRVTGELYAPQPTKTSFGGSGSSGSYGSGSSGSYGGGSSGSYGGGSAGGYGGGQDYSSTAAAGAADSASPRWQRPLSPDEGRLFEDRAVGHSAAESGPAPFVFQLHKRYIVTADENGLQMTDQRMAHERVLFERAMTALESTAAKNAEADAQATVKDEVLAQELLFAVPVTLTQADLVLLHSVEPELRALGFDFILSEKGGEPLVTISAIPHDVRIGDEERTLRDIIAQQTEVPGADVGLRRRAVAAAYATRCAVKVGDVLSTEEMRALLRDLAACGSPSLGPNGRRTKIELSLKELERRFV